LNTDILFALVKQAVLRRRGTLRLVVTSATLRTDELSKYYFDCPLLSVSGRCYPVAILHQDSPKEQRVDMAVQIAIRVHLNEPAGDILAFLTGSEECETACRKCLQKLEELS
jgi:ATP-dependent RNA helicase DHX8/PRP22